MNALSEELAQEHFRKLREIHQTRGAVDVQTSGREPPAEARRRWAEELLRDPSPNPDLLVPES